ncbi:CLK2 [Cordylochernes scorpioides]|uniref:CLK2 n=1 Tax=Cordylochernes scorpioides TaxID=51811 RepID=A0ABY6LKL3_9ARAC|nr:CLK2 [Cordylochernes scorpioides]
MPRSKRPHSPSDMLSRDSEEAYRYKRYRVSYDRQYHLRGVYKDEYDLDHYHSSRYHHRYPEKRKHYRHGTCVASRLSLAMAARLSILCCPASGLEETERLTLTSTTSQLLALCCCIASSRAPSVEDDEDGHLIYRHGDVLQERCIYPSLT